MAGELEPRHTSRPRREDHPTTKHGLPFSKWEVLVGPSDWKDHFSGKDGADRYRVHNLPRACSGPGIYEFAVAVAPSDDSRVIRKLDEACIVPVYIGAAGDIRTRLQQYGRDGAHLDHGNPTSAPSKSESHRRPAGLFKEIFEKGYPILYRWAPVDSKEEAEKKEAELLDKYDYAWNKRGNGPSRRADVLEWLDKMPFCTATPSRGARKGKERASVNKQMGGDGGGSSRASTPRKGRQHPDDPAFHDSIPSVTIVPYRPRLVQESRFSYRGGGVDEEDESVHQNRPVKGITKSCREDEGERTGLVTGTDCRGTRGRMATSCVTPKEELPAAERKRCDSQKGKQIIQSKLHITPEGEQTKETHTCFLPSVTLAGDDTNICGVIRGDGSPCRNTSEKGRKRCGVHKGQRVKESALPESRTIRIEGGQSSPFCGVPFADGSICMESPVCGRKRCEDHKGRRVTGGSSMGGSDAWATGFHVSSSFCGVTMGNGATCMAAPVPGRMRCARHKGRRI